MRKVLAAIVLFFVLGGVMAAAPYPIEEINGLVGNNRSGCTINVQNSSGWEPGFPSVLRVERLEEPVVAGVVAYECGGIVGNPPAAMTLLVPGTGYRAEGCVVEHDPDGCYTDLPTAPAASGTPKRYQVLIQVRRGGPVEAVDLIVTRRVTWRCRIFDALMSV
ncbi:hypothetical protein [Sphingomonas psychrotolerans]|uniref:Uncharacterized protein n=1 Tax=Sphingomonas psychrotolerans TaxID=1327635 RepID=A0A2K8MMB2_9SPHN|nr:hypothetical protein [Sphingomonas psychrotolerans]ATY33746.1 hypothetical protein CVN68_18750 [Sphingomonas psychrotolerans]